MVDDVGLVHVTERDVFDVPVDVDRADVGMGVSFADVLELDVRVGFDELLEGGGIEEGSGALGTPSPVAEEHRDLFKLLDTSAAHKYYNP